MNIKFLNIYVIELDAQIWPNIKINGRNAR
jgi:hypothetical protein